MLRVGIAGASLTNANLGCKALAYSSIILMERAFRQIGEDATYIIFDDCYQKEDSALALDLMCCQLGLEKDRVKVTPVGPIRPLKRFIRNARRTFPMREDLKDTDLVFDLTQGDSFTDIYDEDRLVTYANVRNAAFRYGIPVILGPQTIGPFNTDRGKSVARDTMLKADFVMARDTASAFCAASVSGLDIEAYTDLAFSLPTNQAFQIRSGNKKAGVNVSGLLASDATEAGASGVLLKTNYDAFVNEVCSLLLSKNYEVYLVSHVNGADYPASKRLKEAHPDLILCDEFDTPVDAKGLISSMDIFIGSRMHATIAALSSGVATVPVGYSRKFDGLFRTLGYTETVDLTRDDTQCNIERVASLIDKCDQLRIESEVARGNAFERINRIESCVAERLALLI